mmetsp:Transcript_26996/g.4975  ORF Transcript_26996/g.4975 Transcript_26996/m.4975 type:complete len:116 (+) Transcript_26996:140-487(+)
MLSVFSISKGIGSNPSQHSSTLYPSSLTKTAGASPYRDKTSAIPLSFSLFAISCDPNTLYITYYGYTSPLAVNLYTKLEFPIIFYISISSALNTLQESTPFLAKRSPYSFTYYIF